MKNKFPVTSLLIFFIFLINNPFRFDKLNGEYNEVRFFNQVYTWNIFWPTFILLSLFTLFELVKWKRTGEKNIFVIIFISPVLLYWIFILIQMIF